MTYRRSHATLDAEMLQIRESGIWGRNNPDYNPPRTQPSLEDLEADLQAARDGYNPNR